MRAAAALLLVLAGCGTPRYATVNGGRVERPSIGYGDGFRFAIVHRRAFPGVLSSAHAPSVDDGHIAGRVCGVDVDFDASWRGSHVELIGQADVAWHREFNETGLFGLSVEIAEPEPGHRHIVGRLNGKMDFAVEIDASPERLTARINRRTFTLAADGDFLVGRTHDVRSLHEGEPPRPVDSEFDIYGRQALGTMLPADEAVVLFFMLTCNGVTVERGGRVVPGFSLVPVPSGT